MILCRCACGELYKLEDEVAGGTVECSKCSAQFPVPAESDPEIALVYYAASDEDGLPMLRDDVTRMLAGGELTATDMIWRDGAWNPLGSVFGEAPAEPVVEAAKPKLRLKKGGAGEEEAGAATAEGDAEVKLVVVEKEPEKKIIVARKADGAAKKEKGKERAKEEKENAKATPAAAGASSVTAGGWKGKLAPYMAKIGQYKKYGRTALAVLIVGFGYKFGFGPILASMLRKPSNVIVKAGEGPSYRAVLGWRRLEQELPSGSVCRYQIFVGMPESQTLLLEPIVNDEETKRIAGLKAQAAKAGKLTAEQQAAIESSGKPIKLKVKVRMGKDVIVNVGQKTVFNIVDDAAVKSLKISTELSQVIADIGSGKTPTSALALADKLAEIMKAASKGTTKDLFIPLDNYRPDPFMVDSEAMQQLKLDKPMVTAMPMQRLAFANGSANLTFNQPENVDGSVMAPEFSVGLVPNITLKVSANTPIQVFRLSQRLRIQLQVGGQPLKVSSGQFTGTWDYQASCKLDKSGPAEWRWQWVFRGSGQYKGDDKKFKDKKVNVTCTWNQNQPPSAPEMEEAKY